MKTTLISILLFSFSISVTAQTAEYTEKDSISDLQCRISIPLYVTSALNMEGL